VGEVSLTSGRSAFRIINYKYKTESGLHSTEYSDEYSYEYSDEYKNVYNGVCNDS
jgi:hypothetical protein